MVYLALGRYGLMLAHFMTIEDCAHYCHQSSDPELIVYPYNLSNRDNEIAPPVGAPYRA